MDEYMDEFLNDEGFAPAIHSQPVESETIKYYKDKLPEGVQNSVSAGV